MCSRTEYILKPEQMLTRQPKIIGWETKTKQNVKKSIHKISLYIGQYEQVVAIVINFKEQKNLRVVGQIDK